MTQKERFLKAIKGEKTDRVPVSFYTHLPVGDDNGVAVNVNWINNTGMDMIAIEPDGFYNLHWDKPLKTLADFKALRPYKRSDYFITAQLERAKGVAEGLKGKAAVYYMLFTPFSFVKHTLNNGQHPVMDLWREDTAAFKQVMDVIEENNRLFMDVLYQEAGLDGFFISMQSGEKWRFTREEYRENLTPYDERLLACANGYFPETNIVHLCSWGNEPNNIDLWRDYDFRTVNWGVFQEENLSMRQGKDYFKPGTNVMGGFDRLPEGVLYRGSKEEIKAFTKNLITETGEEHFIISADCSIQEDTPDEHIRWVVEAAEEFAQGL